MNDLIAQLSDASDTVRACAAHNLGVIGDAVAVPALLVMLKSKRGLDRRAAALALGKIGAESSVAALRGAANDRDDQVRRIAAEALAGMKRAA